MVIETDEQRRWWFATHPQFSWGSRGIRGSGQRDRKEATGKVRPEDVDAYVDEALKYEKGPVAELLKSVKRNFGTQAGDNNNEPYGSDRTTADRTTNDKREGQHFRKYSNEELRRMGIPTPEEEALVSDPHTFLDLVPYRRFITAPVQSFKSLFTGIAQDTILYWKKGDDIFARTSKGRVPAWSTIAQRYWKNESVKEGAVDKWGSENTGRMSGGRAPQQTNRKTGQLESRELHHDPIPRRQGGREFMEVWPEEHAAIDPHRRLKKE